jgi:hypothetical protein
MLVVHPRSLGRWLCCAHFVGKMDNLATHENGETLAPAGSPTLGGPRARFSTIQARPPPSAPGKPPLAATRGWAWEAQPVARVEASSRSTSQRTGGTRGVAV